MTDIQFDVGWDDTSSYHRPTSLAGRGANEYVQLGRVVRNVRKALALYHAFLKRIKPWRLITKSNLLKKKQKCAAVAGPWDIQEQNFYLLVDIWTVHFTTMCFRPDGIWLLSQSRNATRRPKGDTSLLWDFVSGQWYVHLVREWRTSIPLKKYGKPNYHKCRLIKCCICCIRALSNSN